MNIIVLAGGLSPERDVSLTSGKAIAEALLSLGHNAYLLDVYLGLDDKNLDLTTLSLEEFMKSDNYGLHIAKGISRKEPDLDEIAKSRKYQTESYFGKDVLKLCQMADITFMALHGSVGENGKIQSAFDLLGIKYTGPSPLGCSISMDKVMTKKVFAMSGVSTPQGSSIYFDEKDKTLEELGVKLPVVVKPNDGGSSIGVYICHTEEDYKKAILESFSANKKAQLIIEPFTKGREYAAAVFAGKALPLVEIIPTDEFFNYEDKYQPGASSEICPPVSIDDKKQREIMDSVETAFKALEMDVYGRADYIVDDVTGEFYCFEMNPLPGMTPASLLPKAGKAAGMTFPELCQNIIDESIRVRYSK
ncbi:MAG: D-alanine--D-alanine ligase [Lachnospiraceae bacterium]|jgi:D-alanine-D-alanine ligase|nr:D-alanine--D-alanine ligase [Lachnospiraceae bacterium]